MREIDIRDGKANENEIRVRFGDNDGDVIELNVVNPCTIFIAGEDSGEVDTKDIDNLILALKKVKDIAQNR